MQAGEVGEKMCAELALGKRALLEGVACWEELRLMEKPLTEEEEAELDELTYRFHPLGPAMKAWEEAAAGTPPPEF